MTNWWFIIPTGILAVIGVGALIWRGGAWYGSVNTDRANFKEFMKEVREDLKKILQRLPERTTASSSPVTLTDYGKTIAEGPGSPGMGQEPGPYASCPLLSARGRLRWTSSQITTSPMIFRRTGGCA